MVEECIGIEKLFLFLQFLFKKIQNKWERKMSGFCLNIILGKELGTNS